MSHNIKLSDDDIERILQDYRLKKETEKKQKQHNTDTSFSQEKSLIDKLKDLIFQKGISVFPVLAIILLLISIVISLLVIVFVCYLDILKNRFDWFLTSFLFFIPFYGIYVKDRIYMKLFENLNIYNGKRDWKKNDFVSVHGTLFSSFTINSFYASLRLFFREEKAEGHLCNVILKNSAKIFKSDYFVYILTRDRLNALQTIYDIEVNYVKGSMVSREIEFKNEVPLIITYGKHSHVLKSIAPVEGYEYTKKQLVAIEKFNTLYP